MTRTKQQKHILIGGGSGFIGRALTQTLRARGDRVTWVSRTPGLNRITWEEVHEKGIPQCDVVINLAGKHILDMRRVWTRNYRDEVIRSRVETTEALVRAINKHANPPSTFISTAGKCFYGSQGFRRAEEYRDLDEHSDPVGLDFPSEVVRLWEAAAAGVDSERVRHVKIRLGVVLGKKPNNLTRRVPQDSRGAYGIFPILHGFFKRGFALSMGSGVQPFPWVHIDDVVGIIVRAIDDSAMQDVFNAVSPGIVSNREFTELFARKLGRSVLGHIPAWIIKAVVGVERSTILLLGQRIRPTRTMASGYEFKFPKLEFCLDDLLIDDQAQRSDAVKTGDAHAAL